MSTLILDLREGFQAEEVWLRAPDLDPIHFTAVKTRMQIGLARSVDLPPSLQLIDVELPARGILQRIDFMVERPLWVGVSLSRDGTVLEVRQQLEPFGYV